LCQACSLPHSCTGPWLCGSPASTSDCSAAQHDKVFCSVGCSLSESRHAAGLKIPRPLVVCVCASICIAAQNIQKTERCQGLCQACSLPHSCTGPWWCGSPASASDCSAAQHDKVWGGEDRSCHAAGLKIPTPDT
jgi:hypothetical protein